MASTDDRRRRRALRRVLGDVATLVGTAALLVLVVGVGTAGGVWSTGGSGHARGTATVPVALGVAPVTTAGDLYPGHTGAAAFTVTNSNAYVVRVTGLSFGAVTTSSAGCPSTHLAAVDQAGLALDVAGGATVTFTVPGALTLASSAPDDCQGVAFTVATTVVGHQL